MNNNVSEYSITFTLWQTVFSEKINLTENEKTLTFDSETAETLNNFFSNKVKLAVPKFDYRKH